MAMIGKGGVRLQKFLSSAGITSRRKAEELITAGRVVVNGQIVTELGTKVEPSRDVVELDGARIRPRTPVYVVMNKPKGTVCSEKDPEGRARVHDLLPKGLPRVFTVGRLDWDTEGLLLFTNDGDLAKALMDPVQHVPRVYRVKIQGEPDPHLIRRFNEGVRLPTGYRTRPAPIELVQRTDTNAWFEVVLSEGKNRQIHRMTEACGHRVLKLVRMSYGPVHLGSLPPGKCRLLTPDEVSALEAAVGISRGRFAPMADPLPPAATTARAATGKPRRAPARAEADESPKPRRPGPKPRTDDARPSRKPASEGARGPGRKPASDGARRGDAAPRPGARSTYSKSRYGAGGPKRPSGGGTRPKRG